MQVFPRWAEFLELGNPAIQGIDCRLHDDPEAYRGVVRFLKSDPLARGALVTTHKIDLLAAARDLFDELDHYAELMGEVSCIARRNGRLVGHAKDPVTSGLALQAFLSHDYWRTSGAEVLVLGAGGSSLAVTTHLMAGCPAGNRPGRIVVSNRTKPRLDAMERIHRLVNPGIPVTYHHAPAPEENDAILNSLKPRSLVINATGLGKDAPGSPVTGAAVFPEGGIVWDFNYRGDLLFLKQARAQARARQLRLEDGWVYFLHGWRSVIAEVFQCEIPAAGPVFDELSRLAAETRAA
jgi:shikimate 5-dehydrogenase